MTAAEINADKDEAASVMLSALLLAQADMIAAGISDVCVEAAIAQASEAGIAPALASTR